LKWDEALFGNIKDKDELRGWIFGGLESRDGNFRNFNF
jgi:hypothetical protein